MAEALGESIGDRLHIDKNPSTIKLIPATVAGLVLLLQPALALIWDVLFFDRPTGITETVGILLILSAIYIGAYKRE